ncbi:MAG: hypothetical protein M5U34_31845 [Chloroflexi bacterium]|nr:hypothetical protein [Chloroflexota bacterium]
MSQERIETNKAPLIEVTACHGDLVIRSWSETAVSIQSDQHEAKQTETGLALSSHGDLKLIVPTNASLHIGQVHGDLVIKRVSGDLSLQIGDGDVVLVGLNNVKLGTINGDLSAKQPDGDLSVETVQRGRRLPPGTNCQRRRHQRRPQYQRRQRRHQLARD